MTGMKRARLSATALGISFGVICGAWMLIVGFLAMHYDVLFAKDMMTRWKDIFPGVDMTLLGIYVAAAWGFLKGFVVGIIFGWIYNLCLCCCTRCCACCQCACKSKASCSNVPSDLPKI